MFIFSSHKPQAGFQRGSLPKKIVDHLRLLQSPHVSVPRCRKGRAVVILPKRFALRIVVATLLQLAYCGHRCQVDTGLDTDKKACYAFSVCSTVS